MTGPEPRFLRRVAVEAIIKQMTGAIVGSPWQLVEVTENPQETVITLACGGTVAAAMPVYIVVSLPAEWIMRQHVVTLHRRSGRDALLIPTGELPSVPK